MTLRNFAQTRKIVPTTAILALAAVFLVTADARAQGTEAGAPTEAASDGTVNGLRLLIPDMDSARGRKLFASKGCVTCHSINGVGGKKAPRLDASSVRRRINPFQFAAKMWLGAGAMLAMQTEAFGSQITFSGDELADIIAFAHDEAEQNKFTEADIPPKIMALMDHVRSLPSTAAGAGKPGRSRVRGVESKLAMADPKRFVTRNKQEGMAGGGDPQTTLPIEQITTKVIGAGYSHIHTIKFENGRYEVGARNKSNRDVLLLIDPRSGAVTLSRVRTPLDKGSFLPVKTILEVIQGAGFGQVSSVGRPRMIYRVVARDAENRTVRVFVHAKTGRLLRHPTSGKPIQKILDPSRVPTYKSTYKSISKVAARVKKAGFTEVYTIEPEHGGYDVRARTPAGTIVKLYVDVDTGEVLRHP